VAVSSLRGREERPPSAPGSRTKARSLLVTARPRQWIKNVLVFAAPASAGVLFEADALALTLVAFAAFCLVSSGMYFINDLKDQVGDAEHPAKRLRPIAAGELSRRTAWMVGCALTLAGLVTATAAGAPLTAAVGGYVLLVLAYTYRLKDIVLVDVVAVAATFVIRAAAGGLAVSVYLSSWFLLVACFGALFVVVGKRFAEYRALGDARASHRRTLEAYSEQTLRSMMTSASTVTITAYCLWAFEGQGSRNAFAALSILPLVLALYRYALRREAGSCDAPEDLLLRDRFLQVACIGWVLCAVSGVYLG
jgi:decaprenyl-phosphate phosphoribosyltransferase